MLDKLSMIGAVAAIICLAENAKGEALLQADPPRAAKARASTAVPIARAGRAYYSKAAATPIYVFNSRRTRAASGDRVSHTCHVQSYPWPQRVERNPARPHALAHQLRIQSQRRADRTSAGVPRRTQQAARNQNGAIRDQPCQQRRQETPTLAQRPHGLAATRLVQDHARE